MDPFLGEIKMVGFNFAPKGYALCNGAIMSIQQNSALFALLGTTFGGNGTTTFGLPDYRSRGPVGMGQGPGLSAVVQGEVAGIESVSLTLANLPSHTHPATAAGLTASPKASTTPGDARVPPEGSIIGGVTGIFAGATTADVTMAAIPVTGTVTIGMAGSSLPVGLRNPYLGTNFVIATEGVFPSRN
jgi:microcystin-dependent protein